jgi:hypothetical protein
VTGADFIFAALPPFFAILLQRFSFPNDEYLQQRANEYAEELRPPSPRSGVAPSQGPAEAARGTIFQAAKGAVAMASVAPTLVSFVISAFALVHDRKDAWVYMLIIVGIGISGAIWGLSKMHSYGPVEIASYNIRFHLGRWHFKRADVIAWVTYLINAGLILLAILVYFGDLPFLRVGG